MARGLGVNESVAADFYKPLVYDTGSFFVHHRGSEKVPCMFATRCSCCPQLIAAASWSQSISAGGPGRAVSGGAPEGPCLERREPSGAFAYNHHLILKLTPPLTCATSSSDSSVVSLLPSLAA